MEIRPTSGDDGAEARPEHLIRPRRLGCAAFSKRRQNMKFIQQGDVLLKKIDSLPEGSKIKNASDKGYVLAEGESTGHAHRITEIASDICRLYEKDGVLYVKALNSVNLTHEEHKQVTIPEGIWEVGIVREYDHFLEEARNVKD